MIGSRFFPILCVLFLLGGYVFGQDTILMGTNNHQEIVSNYCVLYADNGPGVPHSPRVDASYTIKATKKGEHNHAADQVLQARAHPYGDA